MTGSTPRLRRSAYRPGTLMPIEFLGNYQVTAVLMRRDSLRPGDRVVSSHYGERTVESCEQYGNEGQATELRFVATTDRVMSERYESATTIPLVRRAGSLGAAGQLLRQGQLRRMHAALDRLQAEGEWLANA